MANYLAAVFSDLEQHSLAWSQAPRDTMVALIGEYRHLAEAMAGRHGCLHFNFTGDGHLFLYESVDAAVQFGLRLSAAWRARASAFAEGEGVPYTPLRLGCHFGECIRLEGGDSWIGRTINLAKRVEAEAQPESLFVTESVLELVDLPAYRFEEAGSHALKGDHLPKRTLYRVTAVDESAFAAKADAEPTAEAWFLKAVALIGTEKENSEQEAEHYREALRLRPDYAEARNNLAVLLRARGERAEAGEHYREALRLRPDYPEAHYNYAILLEAEGGVAGAAEHYGEALRLRPDYADAHHGLANLLKARNEPAAAREHYLEALRLRSGSPEAHNDTAILLESLGEAEAAREHYREALRLRPDYQEAHYNYAILLEDGGDRETAKEHYERALEIWPDYPEAHNNLAILLHAEGDRAGAARHYLEALRLRPNDPEAHYNYALLLKAEGDEDSARAHFRIAHELAPEVPTFRSATQSPG